MEEYKVFLPWFTELLKFLSESSKNKIYSIKRLSSSVMQPQKSLGQLIDEHLLDESSSQADSEDNNYQNPQFLDETSSNILPRNQNRNAFSSPYHLNQFPNINMLETASSSLSELSLDDIGRGIGGFLFRGVSRRSANNNVQPSRVNSRLIYKNYCKAMVKFNTQPLSEPYLREFITNHNITIDTFRNYIRMNERNIGGLDALKNLLTIRNSDTDEHKALKMAFKMGCEAFLKYFAVNWVFAANIRNTQSYLRQRFLLLRKIKDLPC